MLLLYRDFAAGITVSRNPEWPKVRGSQLIQHPVCAMCGKKTSLQVHHCLPFHLWPEHELNPKNLVTLCENREFPCHLLVGHLGDWKCFNPDVITSIRMKSIVLSERKYEKCVTELLTMVV